MHRDPRNRPSQDGAIEVAGRRRRADTIRSLAARQHGIVTRRQLLAARLTIAAVDSRLRDGRIRALHRGVYLLGPVIPPRAREMAAVLACGDQAYLSHHSAAQLHQLLPLPAQPTPVDVTVAGRNPHARAGVNLHRARSLPPAEVGIVDRIPITSPARTILDLAAELTRADLEQLVAVAYRRKLVSRGSLLALLARHRRRPGTAALHALLDAGPAPAFTRSEAERRFLTLVRAAELPHPRVNARLHGHEVDFLWPDRRLVVEVDGHAFHAARPQRERDSRRDQELTLRGYTVLRVTWAQISSQPTALVARVAAALAR